MTILENPIEKNYVQCIMDLKYLVECNEITVRLKLIV